MSKAAEEAAALALSVAQPRKAKPKVKSESVEAPPLNRRVRLSADIDNDAYRGLTSWCQDLASQLGRANVKHVWAVRALVAELLEDRELADRVAARIAAAEASK